MRKGNLSKAEQTKLEMEAGRRAISDRRTVLEDLAGSRQVLKNSHDDFIKRQWIYRLNHTNAKYTALVLLEMQRRGWPTPDEVTPEIATALMEIIGAENSDENSQE